MIISHKYKLIFIHIYKNGGTFMGKLLKNLDKNIVLIIISQQKKHVNNFLIYGINIQKYV